MRCDLDPGKIVLVGGFLFGLLSFYTGTMALGWILGMAIGIWYTVAETSRTPKGLRRLKFTEYVGSGRYGSPFIHDSRLITIFALGLAGLIAEVVGVLTIRLLAFVLR